jgi:hypothetical protein
MTNTNTYTVSRYNDETERAYLRATRSLTPEELYRARVQQIVSIITTGARLPKPRRSEQGRVER